MSAKTFRADVKRLLADLEARFLKAPIVAVATWQSIKAPQPMVEVRNVSFTLDLPSTDLEVYRKALMPNLPWADEHFVKERVSGDPINPGTTWRIWPYSRSANTHRREGEQDPQFDHSYAERYWPKFAGTTPTGVLEETPPEGSGRQGYRFPYGDLDDLVEVLLDDPLTRQAYLPIWFPEDLGACRQHKRVPCTLGYHFILREGRLHCVYFMRSCDYIRHFRDDLYLTIRLLLWVLDQCSLADPAKWADVLPGDFTVHLTSLHMFESDRNALLKTIPD